MSALSAELRDWIKPGLAGMVAVADATGRPEIVRIWAARSEPIADVVEIYVQAASSGKLRDILARPARAALNLIEVDTYRSRTFKGSCSVAAPGVDETFLDESVTALGRAFSSVGMAPDAAQRMLAHGKPPREMLRLRLAVDSVFDQSPKPGAGERL